MKNRSQIRILALFLIVLVMSIPVAFADQLSLTYDKNGNLVTGDGKYREYNGFNQLIRIRDGNSASGTILQEFLYHPVEERILEKKIYNSTAQVSERVFYVSDTFIRVVNASGTYDNAYIKVEGQLVAQQENGVKSYVHADHLGSASIITDSSGNSIESSSYDPFGNILTGANKTRFDYTGQEFDNAVGDYDFNARRYDPDTGQFVQPDNVIQNAYDPQFLNHYAYVRNNPYNLVDPDGRDARIYLNREAAVIFGTGPYGHYVVAVDDSDNPGEEIVFENSGPSSTIFSDALRSHFSKDVATSGGEVILPEGYGDYVTIKQDIEKDKQMIAKGEALEKEDYWAYIPQFHDSETYARDILEEGGYELGPNYWHPTSSFDNELKNRFGPQISSTQGQNNPATCSMILLACMGPRNQNALVSNRYASSSTNTKRAPPKNTPKK